MFAKRISALFLSILFLLCACSTGTQEEASVELTLGTLLSEENNIEQEAIASFNQQDKGYTVKVVHYEDLSALNTAILAGKGPDLLHIYNIPYAAYQQKGLFLPLNGIVGTLSDGDYFENILSLTSYDNTYPTVIISYYFDYLQGCKSVIGDITSWNLEEFISTMEGSDVFEKNLRGDILYFMLAANLDRFIDPNTAEVRFNTESFVDLLEFSNLFVATYDGVSWDNWPALVQASHPWSPSFNIDQSAYEELGDSMVVINYPSDDFQGPSVNTSFMGLELAAMSTSQHQEESLAFIEYMLSEEAQNHLENFPVNRASFATRVEEDRQLLLEEKQIELTAEDEEYIYSVFESADNIMRVDAAVMDIVLEEAASYFNGNKTAEDVTEIIQDRVSTYVAEQQ